MVQRFAHGFVGRKGLPVGNRDGFGLTCLILSTYWFDRWAWLHGQPLAYLPSAGHVAVLGEGRAFQKIGQKNGEFGLESPEKYI
jgi:hypothetical protein